VFTRFGVGEIPLGQYSLLDPFSVLQGKVELEIGGKVYILIKGDSIYLDSSLEQRWKNIEKSDVLAFVVVTTPIM